MRLILLGFKQYVLIESRVVEFLLGTWVPDALADIVKIIGLTARCVARNDLHGSIFGKRYIQVGNARRNRIGELCRSCRAGKHQ